MNQRVGVGADSAHSRWTVESKLPRRRSKKETVELERPAGGPDINSGGICVTHTRDSVELRVEVSSK